MSIQCQTLEACEERFRAEGHNNVVDQDAKYAARYLSREYYVA